MKYDILKTFKFSHDGVTEMLALIGAKNVDVPSGSIEGLIGAGMICESKTTGDDVAMDENKMIESAPETGDAVVMDANGLPPAAAPVAPETPTATIPPFVQPDEVVEIPENWKEMHWTKRKQLAQQFYPDMEIDNEKSIELLQTIVDNRASFTE